MPYAGEPPITSFFPRISSTAKRRENASLHSHKRKRSSVAGEELNGRATKKKRSQEKQPLCNAELNGPGARMSTFARSAVGRLRTTLSPGPSISSTRSQIDDSSRDEPAAVDGTSRPVIPTLHRPSHHAPSSKLSITNERRTPSTGVISYLPPKSLGPEGSLTCSSLSIPSSQSQESGYESLFCDFVPSETSSLPRQPSLSMMPFMSSGESDTMHSNLPDDLLIVESSQSQPILPEASLPRARGRLNSVSSLSTDYSGTEIIPSSQSQEMDLEQLLAAPSSVEWKANRILYAAQTPAAGPPTSLLPFVPGTHVRDDPIAVEESEGQQNLDDSETEDESDDETPDSRFAKGKGDGVVLTREPVDDSSRQSRIPQSVDGENSLPSVLTDFLNMFGDGDGSYPDDFPFSLR